MVANTESGYDQLTIDGVDYEGTDCPEGVDLTEGSTISWVSDGSMSGDGWEICSTTTGTGGGGTSGGTPANGHMFTVLSGPCTTEMYGTCVGRPARHSDSEQSSISVSDAATLHACRCQALCSGKCMTTTRNPWANKCLLGKLSL